MDRTPLRTPSVVQIRFRAADLELMRRFIPLGLIVLALATYTKWEPALAHIWAKHEAKVISHHFGSEPSPSPQGNHK